jgi:hypothetical protein
VIRHLRDFQAVDLAVRDDALRARAAIVRADGCTLSLARPLSPDAGFLPAPASMAFDGDRGLVMLSGLVYSEDPLTVRFVVDDGVGASHEQRRHARLTIRLPVLVTTMHADGTDAGDVFEAETIDLSAGGTLVALGGLSGRVRVGIELAASMGTVTSEARVIRSTADKTALAFDGLEPQAEALIDRFVVGVRHELARRFAAAA